MEHSVKIPVRQLVELVLRGGSIDNRFGGMERALEGARIHRRLQKEGGERYQAEVFLTLTTQYEEIAFTVEGRADGIITEETGVVIDEIKTTATPLELVQEDFNRVHWAQALCYAYMYSLQHWLEGIAVRLTYFHVETEEIKRFQRDYSFLELEDFYFDLLRRYLVWARWQSQWRQTRTATMRALAFPFDRYRRGQRELAVAVYRTIQAKGKLYCQAPTGIGKTMSTLFPAVKAMGEGETEKIFYLTAKTITRQAAEEALRRMRNRGLRCKSVTLTAKDKICFLEERNCNPEACPYADGHFDRVNDALLELLQSDTDSMTREEIEICAKRFTVCPFELALDLTTWCDCVICDYNYLFDPTVYLKRFFSDHKGEYVFLIDEAHNLVDRSRSMFSAQLKKSAFLQLKKKLGKQEKRLSSLLRLVNEELLALRKRCAEQRDLVQKEALTTLNAQLNGLGVCCEEWLKEHRDSPLQPEVLQLYFDLLSYLKIAELYDERYVTFVETAGSEVTVKQLCLDPSYLLSEAMKRGKASILFSATLTPLNYFSTVLGGDEASKRYLLPSPFSQENLCLLVADRVSTRYPDREQSACVIADLIFTMISEKRGNYLVYFPSYLYMNRVYREFQERYPQVETLEQTSGMEERAREDFLARFDRSNEDTLVGFCVLGGIFSEGIDLKGDRLIGTAVVGVGLPQINREQDILRAYYNEQNQKGYEYAYQFPGMNKVLQAAGRVIRGEQDRGVVLLIDDRFCTYQYQALFPAHWSHYRRIHDAVGLQQALRLFW